jgi:hypothetical protein
MAYGFDDIPIMPEYYDYYTGERYIMPDLKPPRSSRPAVITRTRSDRVQMTDQEIQDSVKLRTTEELIAFREKAKAYNTPEALAARFFAMKELVFRMALMAE